MSKDGFKLLESRDMFLESTKGHGFLGFEGGYFAFTKKGDKYIFYDVCDPDGNAPSYNLLRYARSAVFYDFNSLFDEGFADKERPILNYLLN